MNITGVKLETGSKTSSRVVNSPRVDPHAQVLEVVIAQTNQSIGELNFNVSGMLDPQRNALTIPENIGTLQLKVSRTGSTVGQVGFRYVVKPITSGPYAAANGSDFSPQKGHVTFMDGETSRKLDINITDDHIPEVQEAFLVQMSRPLGGVRIGRQNSVIVLISPNDNPYGLFGYVLHLQCVCYLFF